jgi:hypothetical protein
MVSEKGPRMGQITYLPDLKQIFGEAVPMCHRERITGSQTTPRIPPDQDRDRPRQDGAGRSG